MNNNPYGKIKMNFENDIREQMIKLLKENCNSNFNEKNTTLQLLISYFNSVNRRIYPKPRKVLISNKITKIITTNKIDGHNSIKEIKAIDALKKFVLKFENGEDMNGHLSKNIYYSNLFKANGGGTRDWKSRDYLLDDWGIHHIHLNFKDAFNEKDMKNNRSNYLLFIRITDSIIYFIDVKKHETIDFNNLELVETMDKNWPYLIKGMPINIKSTDILSNIDIKNIRKNHQLAIYNINGRVCFPMGGGLNSIGSNIMHTENAEMILEDIEILEKNIIKHFESIIDDYSFLEFKLECVIHSNIISGYLITEVSTGYKILFNIESNKLVPTLLNL